MNRLSPHVKDLIRRRLDELRQEEQELQAALDIATLAEDTHMQRALAVAADKTPQARQGKPRRMSKSARAKISAAQRARWAQVRREKGKSS